MTLKGRNVLIIGGSGLLGSSFSKAVLKEGGNCIIGDLIFDRNKFSEEERRKLDYIKMSITQKDSIDHAIDYILKNYKKLDAIVLTAYPKNKNYGRKFEEVKYEDFCENVNLHLGGYFLVIQQFAEYFKKQGYGNIIVLSSVYGVIPPKFEIYEKTNMTMPVEYACIKSAIIHLVKYVAKYYKGFNIKINCISPGGIYNNQDERFVKAYNPHTLTKGMLDPDDISGAVVFLLSDASKYINGQNLIIDDGFSL